MEIDLLKVLLSRLSMSSFEAFVVELFSLSEHDPFEPLSEAGDGVFYQPVRDSYGGSIHSVFVIHYLPTDLFRQPEEIDATKDPLLMTRLRAIKKIYKNKFGAFGFVSEALTKADKLSSLAFLTNMAGIKKQKYEDVLIPRYASIVREDLKLKRPEVFVGSYDSFVELNLGGTKGAFKRFVTNNRDGLSICLNENQPQVAKFSYEISLSKGVLRGNKLPCEPVFVSRLQAKEAALQEFEALIQSNAKESDLENFLVAHYKDIFGSKYDRVETQIWLRFPELDIVGKERRTDIFLRNSVSNDWELFEIKRAVLLTGTYRDVPVVSREVVYAMQQVKNYARILSQDIVKRKLAQEGIEYCEPTLNLVIGRKPQIPHQQWRWLVSSYDKEVRLITFDDLLEEMRQRLTDRASLLDSES